MRLGQGRGNGKSCIGENPQLMTELESKVRKALGIGVPELTVIEGGGEPRKEKASAK